MKTSLASTDMDCIGINTQELQQNDLEMGTGDDFGCEPVRVTTENLN